MDIVTGLQDKTVLAAAMTATGINPTSMRFINPAFVSGNTDVYTNQFACGWSAQDLDGDTDASDNCARLYNNVAQHDSNCWSYHLGADSDAAPVDGGVGPHVRSEVATAMTLQLQPSGGTYSQVKRIARFTRW